MRGQRLADAALCRHSKHWAWYRHRGDVGLRHQVGEFALAQLLVGARFETVSIYSLDLLTRTNSDFPILAVLTVLTVVILFTVSVGVVWLDRGQANRLYPGTGHPKRR